VNRLCTLVLGTAVVVALASCEGRASSPAPGSLAETPEDGASTSAPKATQAGTNDLETGLVDMYEGFFEEAFTRGDYRAAFAYLSSECQARVSYADFEQYFTVGAMFLNGATLDVRGVTVLETDGVTASARLRYSFQMEGEPVETGETDAVRAIMERGAWRFADCEPFTDLR
jgi:hypothetical protein